MKSSIVAAAGLILLICTLTLTNSGQAIAQGMKPFLAQIINTEANPVPVIPVVTAADRVQLELSITDLPECTGFTVRRILADGTVVDPFSVPPGKVLVLTDLQGDVSENVPWDSGDIVSIVASIETPGGTPRLAAAAQVNAEALASKIMTVSAHAQSGVLAGSNAAICLGAAVVGPGSVGIATIQRARLQGYLIPE